MKPLNPEFWARWEANQDKLKLTPINKAKASYKAFKRLCEEADERFYNQKYAFGENDELIAIEKKKFSRGKNV